jgi:glycosyltransferase involved in cell wall biosynthesis
MRVAYLARGVKMPKNFEIKKIAFLSDYLPRKCGIATFTHDLFDSVAKEFPQIEGFVVPVNDLPEGYDYPDEVRFEFFENDLDSYRRTVDYLNFSDADIVCVQHEYGIYGGTAGSYLLALLRELKIPVVTTLHTILEKPNPEQRRVLQELASLSARLVVMSKRGKQMLQEIYGVAGEKIDLIPHGIPDVPFVDPNFSKDQFGVEGKYVLLTFGLLSPNKGIENVLRALPKILEKVPNLVYLVLGATHPNLVREHGEAYRLSLERLAEELGVQKNVSFYNRFVELDELMEFIGVADIYITPYLTEAQITSGTLAYAFGSGKAVISTPYWHAEELLADKRGILVPFGDANALAQEVIDLLQDDTRRHALRKQAYMMGRDMTWDKTAKLYMESFRQARRQVASQRVRRLKLQTLDQKDLELPKLRLDHLQRMTDLTGIFQHANYTFPNYEHGYCTDDNARALIATVILEDLERTQISRLSTVYASFMQHAFVPETGHFRNFMSFDHRWLEKKGSEDSQGRALWTLGTCVGRSQQRDLQSWAAQLFEQALPPLLETTSPRTWAFALLGIHEYFRRLSGNRMAAQVRDTLTQRLLNLFEQTAGDNWQWFENTVSYDNARLSQALIVSGRSTDNAHALDIGLRSLKWLTTVQKSSSGNFRPIGSNGFYQRDNKPASFDQQPIEANATISACLEAYYATNDEIWYKEARIAFEWFLGRNDLGLLLYDSKSGGCRDGLHIDRVNQNQGAESTLAYILSVSEMAILENSFKVFHERREEKMEDTKI